MSGAPVNCREQNDIVTTCNWGSKEDDFIPGLPWGSAASWEHQSHQSHGRARYPIRCCWQHNVGSLQVGNVSTWGRHTDGSALVFRAVSPCTWLESPATLQTVGGTAFLVLADKKHPAAGQSQARHRHAFEQWQKAGKQFIEGSGVCAFSLPAFK